MNITLRYRSMPEHVPAFEVLRSMRDMMVTEIRSTLLAGLFRANPDELDVYGEILPERIRITVQSLVDKKASFSKIIDLAAAPSLGGDEDVSLSEPHPAKPPGVDDIIDTNPLMNRVALSNKISEDEFAGKVKIEELHTEVSAKIREVSKAYIQEYMKVRATSRGTK